MIESYACKGYKPFREEARVRLAPLTLFFGHNSSGKSALIRLPRLLTRMLSGAVRGVLPLEVDDLVFGRSSLDLVHERSTFGAFTLEAVCGAGEKELTVQASIQNVYDAHSGRNRAVVERWRLGGALEETLQWDGRSDDPPEYVGRGAVDFHGLWPSAGPAAEKSSSWRMYFDAIERTLVHLGPHRSGLEPTYLSKSEPTLGFRGADAPHLLHADRTLEERVGTWFRENLDVDLALETMGESFRVVARRGRASLNAVELGEGSKQVLPVVTILASMMKSVRRRLAIFEQPELHLHDAAQGALADLFVDVARERSSPLLVETHSELFLLRVRRRVAEGLLRPDDVAIYWLQPTADGAATAVRRMHVREDGWVEDWPQGVYEETFRVVAALQRASRARRERSE